MFHSLLRITLTSIMSRGSAGTRSPSTFCFMYTCTHWRQSIRARIMSWSDVGFIHSAINLHTDAFCIRCIAPIHVNDGRYISTIDPHFVRRIKFQNKSSWFALSSWSLQCSFDVVVKKWMLSNEWWHSFHASTRINRRWNERVHYSPTIRRINNYINYIHQFCKL